MLKKLNRLPKTAKLKSPRYFKTPIFTLKIASNNLENNRFTFVVKKTLDRRATVRNRVKRVLRSCIEELLEEIKTGYDMLFLLEKGIIGKQRKEVYIETVKTLKENKLLK